MTGQDNLSAMEWGAALLTLTSLMGLWKGLITTSAAPRKKSKARKS